MAVNEGGEERRTDRPEGQIDKKTRRTVGDPYPSRAIDRTIVTIEHTATRNSPKQHTPVNAHTSAVRQGSVSELIC